MLCALALLGAGSAAAQEAKPLDEVASTRRVCEAGTVAAVARAQRLKGEAAVAAADVLPNPALVVEHQQTLVGPVDRQTTIGLSVPLALGGRRGLLQDAAQARREQALADAHATLFDTALAYREAFAAAVLDEARLAAMTEQQQALDELTLALGRLARVGENAGYDLLRQQSQGRLHRLAMTAAKVRAEAGRTLLEAWTGEKVTLPAVKPGELAGGAPVVPAGVAATASTTAASEGEHPRVVSLEAGARASGLEADAARRRWIPDLQVFVAYRGLATSTGEMGHGITLGLTLPLPFFDHGQGEAAQADAERAAATASATALKRENAARGKASARTLDVLEASTADADQSVTDAVGLIAKARKLYEGGEVTITELLDAYRGAEEARLARIDLAESIVTARIAKMRAAGSLRDAALDKACGAGAGGGK